MKQKYIVYGLMVLFVLTRVINLNNIPIFNDESTYLRYGLHQVLENDHKYYSLLIGKEPLMPFLYGGMGALFSNSLEATRMVSVISGLLTLIGLILLSKTIGNTRIAIIAAIIYILGPYFIFFDRLALMDSPINAISVWSLYFCYKILQSRSFRYSLLLGITVGVGLWIKTTGLFFLFLPVIIFIRFSFKDEKTRISLFKLFSVSTVLSLGIYFPLYFSPFFSVHKALLTQYTYPLISIFSFPIAVWASNFSGVFQYLFFLLTPVVFLTGIASMWILRKRKELYLVYLWFILPLLYIVFYAKMLTARHTLVLAIPLVIFAACGFELFLQKKRLLAYCTGSLFFLCSLAAWIILLFFPQEYPNVFAGSAKNDLKQYFYGFSSGYGVEEAIQYLKQKSEQTKITVLVRNDHGNPEDAVFAYLYYNPQVQVLPFVNFENEKDEIKKKIKTSEVYYVSRGAYYAGVDTYFVGAKKFLKPNDTEFVGVYRLKLN